MRRSCLGAAACLLTLSAAAEEPRPLPALPEPATSFGAAVLDQALYIYGGNLGEAHSYSRDQQGDTLWRLDLREPQRWRPLAAGPPLQGLALAAHGEEVIRVGGFTAENEAGEESRLVSQAGVARLKVTGEGPWKWTPLPPLPEPRSSFDAAVLEGRLYVVGGWQLRGEEESRWHDTAYVMDLGAETPGWTALPRPPFQRRALAVAAHGGEVYAIGGMDVEGGPSTRVDIYDPRQETWRRGPDLQGPPMTGFGCAAYATAGRLYVSTIEGDLQCLGDGRFEVCRQLETPRFFHRMLPAGEHELLLLGGGNSDGKTPTVERIDLRRPATP